MVIIDNLNLADATVFLAVLMVQCIDSTGIASVMTIIADAPQVQRRRTQESEQL